MTYPLALTRLLIRTGIIRFLPCMQRWTEGGSQFLHHYSNRLLTAPQQGWQDAAPIIEQYGPDAIDLSLSSPRFDLVPSSSTKLPMDRRGCPPAWGLAELRSAVADKLRTDQGLAVNPDEEVLVTQGATGAFSTVLDTFINPGDRVVLFDPTSPPYIVALKHRQTRIRWVSTWMDGGRTRFHADSLAKAMYGARLVVVSSPTNPTGGVFSAEDLERMALLAQRRDVLIFQDTSFERYSYEGTAPGLAALPAAASRTLTAGSLSKGYALASARVGWLTGHRQLIRPCALTTMLQTSYVPTLCQQVALMALRQPEGAFDPIRREYVSRRLYTYERLQAAGLNPAWPAGAYFFWVPVWELGMSGREFSQRLLRSRKVLVTPGEMFGPSGAAYVRVSYAAEDGRLREGLSRLVEFVRTLQPVEPEALSSQSVMPGEVSRPKRLAA